MDEKKAKKEQEKFDEELNKRKDIKFHVSFESDIPIPEDKDIEIGEEKLNKRDVVKVTDVKKKSNKDKPLF